MTVILHRDVEGQFQNSSPSAGSDILYNDANAETEKSLVRGALQFASQKSYSYRPFILQLVITAEVFCIINPAVHHKCQTEVT